MTNSTSDKHDSESSTPQSDQSGSTDHVLNYMMEHHIPLTREKYLALAYGNSEVELGPEEEEQIPEQFQKWDDL